MYEVEVFAEFCAAHAISIAGCREPMHGHNWRVLAVIAGSELDDDSLLCDFHLVQKALNQAIEPFINADLNASVQMAGLNPTAEIVACTIAHTLDTLLAGSLGAGVKVARVSVTEAAGCRAVYHMT